MAKAEGGAVSAGRGVIYISLAKLYFMAVGLVIETVLPRLLGAAGFGGYKVVTNAVSVLNNVMVTGTVQAVSRETIATDAPEDVKRLGFRLHLVVGLPVAIAFALLAPVWAWLAHDEAKAQPLAMAAGIVVGYAFYAVLVGSANGRRLFHKQAGLDITFANLRAIGILGAAWLGLGVMGAVAGWVIAVGLILIVAALWVGLPRNATPRPLKPMLKFLVGVSAFLLLQNLIMLSDVLLLKRIAADIFLERGLGAVEVAHEADKQVGYYSAALNLARLPYQLLLAVAFIVFPLISKSTFAQDLELTRTYIRTTLRYTFLAALGMGIVMGANAAELILVPYPDEFGVGAGALASLAPAYVAFTVFSIAGTMLNGAGETRSATTVCAITLVALVAGLWLIVPHFEPGQALLGASGFVSLGAMALGATLGIGVLWRRFGAGMPLASFARGSLAAATTWFVGGLWQPTAALHVLADAVLCFVVYVVVLLVTLEVRRKDVQDIVSSLKRRKQGAPA